MNRFFTSAKRYWYLFQDFFPTALPVGLTAYDKWVERLYFTYFPKGSLPPSEASQRFSVAALILHLGFREFKKPNRYFGAAIRKGAASEVASYVMNDLKQKQVEAQMAEQQAETLRTQLANTPTQTQADATATQAPQGETQH